MNGEKIVVNHYNALLLLNSVLENQIWRLSVLLSWLLTFCHSSSFLTVTNTEKSRMRFLERKALAKRFEKHHTSLPFCYFVNQICFASNLIYLWLEHTITYSYTYIVTHSQVTDFYLFRFLRLNNDKRSYFWNIGNITQERLLMDFLGEITQERKRIPAYVMNLFSQECVLCFIFPFILISLWLCLVGRCRSQGGETSEKLWMSPSGVHIKYTNNKEPKQSLIWQTKA